MHCTPSGLEYFVQINVAEELKSIGKTTDRHLEESLEPISFGGNKLVFTMPLSVDVRSSFDGEGFSVSGVLSSELLMHCTKCNKEFKQGFNIDFSERFIKASEESPYNKYTDGPNKKLGIIACGIGYNYLMENYPEGCEYPVLKIGQYPLPKKQLLQLVESCDEILVLEDGQPFVEKHLKGYLGIGIKVKGRLDGTLSQDGELNPDSVARAVGKENKSEFGIPSVVEMRPPALCEGCGHRDMYITLTEVLKEEYPSHKVFSDIGCYTLGANAPFNAINSCVDMGASITMAKGAADGGLHPSVAVIGDSTFTHSGMTGLLDCVNENANVVIVISDNETTAMTGGQDSAGTGRIESICIGLGVDPAHIRVVVPLKKNHEEMRQIIREEIEYNGVSVIIPRRECIQTLARKKRSK